MRTSSSRAASFRRFLLREPFNLSSLIEPRAAQPAPVLTTIAIIETVLKHKDRIAANGFSYFTCHSDRPYFISCLCLASFFFISSSSFQPLSPRPRPPVGNFGVTFYLFIFIFYYFVSPPRDSLAVFPPRCAKATSYCGYYYLASTGGFCRAKGRANNLTRYYVYPAMVASS